MSTFNITGIDAQAKKNNVQFSTLRPAGAVELRRDELNAYDPYAIEVWFGDVQLGFVPGCKVNGEYVGSDLQKTIIRSGITTASVERYAYKDGDNFNEEHKGLLGSVTLNLEMPDNDSGRVIGGNYMRCTQFIGYLSPYGGNSDGLIRWAFDQAVDGVDEYCPTDSEELFDAHKKALNNTCERGTALHLYIESDLRGEPTTGLLDAFPEISDFPNIWARFRDKYELDPCYMEKRFYDNTLMVTGQPDFVGFCNGKLMVLDWKSSAKPSMTHELQLAIYAKNAHWDGEKVEEAMVVCFGSDNKQGFATRTIKRDKIERIYSGMVLLKQVMDLCGVYVREYWNGDDDKED